MTVHDLLVRNLPARADHRALVLGDDQLTYAGLAREVERVAAWLSAAGVVAGDRVGVHLHKSFDEVIATFACARIGAVFVNINYQWTVAQLDHIRGDCGIRVLCTDARKRKQLDKAGVGERFDAVCVAGKTELPDAPLPEDAGAPADDDLAALLYTSGSTGKPKGVMLTHRNIVLGAESVSAYLNNTADDRILSLLPMSFDYGLNQFTTMFLVGGTVVLQPVPMAAEIAKTVRERAVNGVALVPTSWTQLVRYLQDAGETLPLRYVTNTGGKIPQPVLEAMPQVFPGTDIVLMYGLTEAFRSTYLPPELFSEKMGAIGRAIPNVEIFVVDAEEGVRGPGGQGELVHRGPLISNGYWGAEALTADKIRVNEHLRTLIGDEKVLHSGDLVRLDEDGILWFTGRADSMIKCSGFRLSPTEVEDILQQSGLIGEAVAFGVDDEMFGQVVHAAVSVRGEGPGEIDVDALMLHCRKNMPNYMVPARIWPWAGALPRMANGKIDRTAVIDDCLGRE